jgi:hypothetical protein
VKRTPAERASGEAESGVANIESWDRQGDHILCKENISRPHSMTILRIPRLSSA